MIEILTPDKNIVTQWSGGQTNQLFIWPETADFKSGDFQIRLSTATVEIEASTFTSLPDVDRTLIVLEGRMKLIHEGHHEKDLAPYNYDQFSGSWTTKSVGKCTDFNLMTKGKIKSEVEILELNSNEIMNINLNGDHLYLYTHNSALNIEYIGHHSIEKRSLVVIKNEDDINEIVLGSNEPCQVIAIRIRF